MQTLFFFSSVMSILSIIDPQYCQSIFKTVGLQYCRPSAMSILSVDTQYCRSSIVSILSLLSRPPVDPQSILSTHSILGRSSVAPQHCRSSVLPILSRTSLLSRSSVLSVVSAPNVLRILSGGVIRILVVVAMSSSGCRAGPEEKRTNVEKKVVIESAVIKIKTPTRTL